MFGSVLHSITQPYTTWPRWREQGGGLRSLPLVGQVQYTRGGEEGKHSCRVGDSGRSGRACSSRRPPCGPAQYRPGGAAQHPHPHPPRSLQIIVPSKYPTKLAKLLSMTRIRPASAVEARYQCWGPGSACLGLPALNPLVRGMDLDPDPSLFSLLSGLKLCLQNKILTQNFSKKLNF
jgi:hypothetical protein